MQTRKRARLRAHGWSEGRITAHVFRWRRASKGRLVRLSEAQGHRCCYCGTRTWISWMEPAGNGKDQATTEHVVAVVRGGSEAKSNKVMACDGCNRARGDMDASEFDERGPSSTRKTSLRGRKRAGAPCDRLDAWASSRTYGGMVLCLATILHYDETAKRLVDDILPGGPLHMVRRQGDPGRDARRSSFA